MKRKGLLLISILACVVAGPSLVVPKWGEHLLTRRACRQLTSLLPTGGSTGAGRA
jgi:hypothetical protein